MSLEQLSDGVFHATSSVRLLPGAHLPTRMTIWRRTDGSLALHSPVEMDAKLASQVRALGSVSLVIAPNDLHHLHAQGALEHFPEARCIASRGVAKKQSGLRVAATIAEAQAELERDVECHALAGCPGLNEWVFFHRPSGTLITTDLVFNVQRPKGWLTPWLLRSVGTHRRLAVSRLVVNAVKDRAAFLDSVRPLLRLPLKNLVMSHGDVVTSSAGSELARALRDRFSEL